MRAAIYTRVSSQKQVDEGYSLSDQRKKCEAFAQAKSWTVEGIYEDPAASGGKKSRPRLDAMVEAINAGRVDVVISPWLDRIGRSAVHSHELYAIFDAADIALWTPDGTKYSGDSAAAKLQRSAMAMSAEYERDMIKERAIAGAAAKKERGAFNGGPIPFGYELGETGGLVVSIVEAKWVRHMFQRYAHDGASFYEIGKELGAANVTTKRGGKWTGMKVAELIKSPVYIARLSDGTKAKHEPLIDEDTFRRAQERIQAAKSLGGNGRGRRSSAHLLSHGLLRCQCGEGTTPSTDPNGRKYYRCRRKRGEATGTCTMPNLPQELVDDAILHFLSEHVISFGKTASELEAEQKQALKDATKAKSEAEKQIKLADEREVASELKWIDGKITDQRWQELQTRFDAERQQAKAALETAETTQKALAEPDGEAIEAVERLRADLAKAATDELTLPRYRALLVKLFEHVEVIEAVADAPEVVDEDFPTPTFLYKSRRPVTGRDREHRYYLLPVLRPELAMLYGDPVKWAGASELIEGHGCP